MSDETNVKALLL